MARLDAVMASPPLPRKALTRDNAEAIGQCAQAARGRPGSAMHDHGESAGSIELSQVLRILRQYP
jgi:hypothetical protein